MITEDMTPEQEAAHKVDCFACSLHAFLKQWDDAYKAKHGKEPNLKIISMVLMSLTVDARMHETKTPEERKPIMGELFIQLAAEFAEYQFNDFLTDQAVQAEAEMASKH